jgi:Flp pilus assembly protein TadG
MLLLLLVAGIEIGRLAYADIEVSNAARAGVAWAMQSHAAAAQPLNIEAAAKLDAPDLPNLVVDPPILTCYCETSAGVTTGFASCAIGVANTTLPKPILNHRICSGKYICIGRHTLPSSRNPQYSHPARKGNYEGGTGLIMPTTLRRMVAVATGDTQRRSAHGECGAGILEMALSLTILIPFLFGIMEVCLGAYTYHYISEAAREATRYAIVRGSTFTTDCSGVTLATCIAQGGNNSGDIATYVQNLSFPGIDPNKMTVNSTWLTSAGTACGTTDSCKPPGNFVQVTILYNFPLSVPFVPVATWTLTSTSQMVISQ